VNLDHACKLHPVILRLWTKFRLLQLEDYLLATWHPSTRPDSVDFSNTLRTQWLGLQIKQCKMLGDKKAQVEFIARYKIGGQSAQRLHEISDFIFEDGRWFYVSGVFPT
jgi:SEC-C motif domain protein